MSCAQGTSSHTIVHCSSDAACRMTSGFVPLRSTALLQVHSDPIQWNFAPVWYSGGMHRKQSSFVVW